MHVEQAQSTQRTVSDNIAARPIREVRRADLCEQAGHKYFFCGQSLLKIHIEIAYLTHITSEHKIEKLKFVNWGNPNESVTDNVTQLSPDEFRIFAETYEFMHTKSSPYFLQSIGEVETAVQSVMEKTQTG